MRVGRTVGALLLFGFALHLHHHFHGPPIDYAGLAVAAAASFLGVPGPGEPVLIAAGIFAAKHELDIATVLFAAWAGATAGGIGGWLLGMKFGRSLVTAPGPLLRTREGALARGQEFFARFTVLAVILTPSWVAGILRVRTGVYMVANALSALIWAVGIGLGAYFAGPAIVEFVDDLGLVTGIVLLVLILGAVAIEVRRRRGRQTTGKTPTG